MSTSNVKIEKAVCRACRHDLAVRTVPDPDAPSGQRSNGHAYCTNDACGYSRRAYPLSPHVENGKPT